MPLAPPSARRRALRAAAASWLAPWWNSLAWAQSGNPRVALVVGNSAYPAAPLRNAGNDATAMARSLAELGFEVVQAKDARRDEMQAAVATLGDRLRGRTGVGLLFYAGHALQVDWRNFLLPVDAAPTSAVEVPAHSLDLQAVVDTLRAAGTRLNIVVLDACRDNPFGTAGGSGKGLAPMDAPPGTYLAYATAPGHTADDGDAAAGNGLYTRFLLREIGRRGARIEDVFKRVRLQVRQASGGRQVPWDASSLEEDFIFATGQRAPEASQRERLAAFEVEKAEWDRIRESTRPEDFYEFLQRFPNGSMSELAQFRLDRLARPQALAAGGPPTVGGTAAVTTALPGADRYAVGDEFVFSIEDRLAPRASKTEVQRVTTVEQGRVLINGGELMRDQMGNTLRSPTATFDTGISQTPADLRVGKRWRSSTWGRARPSDPPFLQHMDFRAVDLRPVDTPAGRFTAFRVVGEGERIFPSQTLKVHTEYWVDAATMWMVVEHVLARDPRGTAVRDVLNTLVSFKRAPRPPA